MSRRVMPTERIAALRELMLRALAMRGLAGEQADILVDDYLGAQLEGRPAHGLSRFLLLDEALAGRGGPPRLVRQTAAYALVDGQRELGQLAAMFCIDLLARMAGQSGLAMVGLFNASRYGRLTPYGRKLADAGFVGILLNGAGSPVVAPRRGGRPVIGTNPVCFAFPATGGSLVFDFATSKRSWSEILQAAIERRPLPDDVFLDGEGNPTRDPRAVAAVLPFGEVKGFALGIAIEILAGALVAARMGSAAQTQYDLGFLFIAIDPAVFTSPAAFRDEAAALASEVRASDPSPFDTVRFPGDRSRARRQQAEASGVVEVEASTLAGLIEMSRGEKPRSAVAGFLD